MAGASSSGWLVVAASVLLFLAAAKSHGWQVRLERELAGYPTVTFGGVNPPFVESLWRRDRVRFWSIVLSGAVLAIAAAFAARRSGWAVPPFRNVASSIAVIVLLWLPVVAFATLGALSAARLAAATPPPALAPDWLGRALWGSAGWWGLVLALAGAVALLALRTFRA